MKNLIPKWELIPIINEVIAEKCPDLLEGQKDIQGWDEISCYETFGEYRHWFVLHYAKPVLYCEVCYDADSESFELSRNRVSVSFYDNWVSADPTNQSSLNVFYHVHSDGALHCWYKEFNRK